MKAPLFPHTLKPYNFSATQATENCPPFWDGSEHECRTLDGWVESFFGSREDDFELLFNMLVVTVAKAVDCDVDDNLIDSITSDDMDTMTEYLSPSHLCSIWHSIIRKFSSNDLENSSII